MVLENTVGIEVAAPTVSGALSRPNFGDRVALCHAGAAGFGWGGLVREAGRMAIPMFSTPHPPNALENANGVSQSRIGAETMTKVDTPTTPKTGISTPIARQQAIENALSTALYFIRKANHPGDLQAATLRAIRAASMLKQACTESATAVTMGA
jgi:hypothetical protein